jgi:hypothetical protein
MTNISISTENAHTPTGLWEASNYPGTTHAQISKDAGLWHFGVADSPSGGVLVLDMTQSRPDCVARTLAVADNYACYLVSGSRDDLTLVIEHVKNLMRKVDADEEFNVFMSAAQLYYPIPDYTQLRHSPIVATASTGPEVGVYPANVSVQAKPIWDTVLTAKTYLSRSKELKTIQKWGLVTRLFLDACNRKGITPFASTTKSKTLEALSTRYAEQRKIASQLERQVFYNMNAEGLVEDLDRGVWSYYRVDYINNRYAMILQTRWLSHKVKPSILAKHLSEQEDFVVSPLGGYEHSVSPITKLNVRIQKHPGVAIRMILLFSKDLLLQLGVTGRNRDEMLLTFEDVAKDFVRSRKFHKAKQ